MNQSEITNIKNEPTDSTSTDQGKISSEMQVESVKLESDCLVQSDIYIKKEPAEVENEFPVIASTSYDMCSNYDMKIESDEPMIKIECEDMVMELMQDPLDVSSKIQVEEHFSVDLDQYKPRIKTELTEGEKNEFYFENDKDDLQGSGSNRQQVLMLIRKNPHCTDMLIHGGEKPHVCVVCKKALNRKSNLNSHTLIHSGKKPFSCDVCDKSFSRKQNPVIHKRFHAGEKSFTCDVCEKAFTIKSHLTEHRRTHAGEKPYSCDICNKSFTQKSTLTRHKKIHKN